MRHTQPLPTQSYPSTSYTVANPMPAPMDHDPTGGPPPPSVPATSTPAARPAAAIPAPAITAAATPETVHGLSSEENKYNALPGSYLFFFCGGSSSKLQPWKLVVAVTRRSAQATSQREEAFVAASGGQL